MIISYPGGSGGNWIKKVITGQKILLDTVNFHYRENPIPVKIIHETDVAKFDYLYSGTFYFNFYTNVLLKHYLHEQQLFELVSYESSFLTCVNTARYVCKFDQIKKHIFLNFDDLIDYPDKFIIQIHQLQKKLGVRTTTVEDFINYRDIFIRTCVNTSTVYENFDNMFWVCFVIGQLMDHNCVPDDFVISDYNNQDKCKKFAKENYHLCNLTKIKFFDTQVFLPPFA